MAHTSQPTQDSAPTTGWRITAMRGGSSTISHPIIAVAPGCPDGRHPTRDCPCQVFRNRAQAQAYVDEQSVNPPSRKDLP